VAGIEKDVGTGRAGKITNWNQIRYELPGCAAEAFTAQAAIRATFDYFTEAINANPKQPRDFTRQRDDNVLCRASPTTATAIGYFGYAYYARDTDKGSRRFPW